MNQIVIGTAGHIDHGKTALVKALTGTDTDRLAEEKARGITIDLGFAHLDQSMTIIDVPGHEKFIRNMVAGVSTIHIALLVIAADDGIMPQTREHLHILNLLGIQRGILVMTKTDLAVDEEWQDLVELDIRELVRGTFLAEAPLVKTSVESGGGIEELRRFLYREAELVTARIDRGFFRLPVDRVFSKTGFGTVVTGTVLSGSASPGEELELVPHGKSLKIRGLQSHGEKTNEVSMGDRAALNIAGNRKSEARRGTELVTHGWIKPVDRIIAQVTLTPDTGWDLKNKQRIHLHIGTAEVLARVTLTTKKVMKSGMTENVIFDLEHPVSAAMDDRFIIRSYSPMETMGGCLILDLNPEQKGRHLKEWASALHPDPVKRLKQFVIEKGKTPQSPEAWTKVFHNSREWIQKALEESDLTLEGQVVYSPDSLEECLKTVQNELEKFHNENPYVKALSLDRLITKTGFSGPWLKQITGEMESRGILKEFEGGFALTSHDIILSNEDKKISKQIDAKLKELDLNLPSADEIGKVLACPPKKVLELLHLLKSSGQVHEVAQGQWVHDDGFNRLLNSLQTYFQEFESLKVADFKTLTGTTRKSAIPLLEYCDKMEFTRREGDLRMKGDKL